IRQSVRRPDLAPPFRHLILATRGTATASVTGSGGTTMVNGTPLSTRMAAGLAGAVLFIATQQSAAAENTPKAEPAGIAAFTRLPKYIDPKISPKGTYLGVLVNEDNRWSLGFINLKTRQFASGLTPDRGYMVYDFIWANDERAIGQVALEDPMYTSRIAYGELYAASANGRDRETIFDVRKNFEWAYVMDRIRGSENTILIGTINMRDVGD